MKWGSLTVDWFDRHNGLLTALATVALVVLTVFIVSDANDQGVILGHQTKIMSDANDINVAVQRAFVNAGSLKSERIFVENESSEKRAYWRFSPILTNDGSTPTRNLRVYTIGQVPAVPERTASGRTSFQPEASIHNTTLMFFIPFAEPPTKFLPPDPENGFGKGNIAIFIGPHGSQTVSDISVPEDALIASIKAGWHLHILGEMKYNDTFKGTPQRITKFCYEISGDFSVVGDFTPVRNFCPHWNCADDECKSDKEANDRDVAIVQAENAKRAATVAPPPTMPTTRCLGPRTDCPPAPP